MMNAKVRVLLVDDEADSLLPTLAQHLEPLGFSFVKESIAANAIDAIDESQPDAVLLDLHFPGDELREDGCTTGGALLTALRRQCDELPVVVFTTRLDDADIPLEAFVEHPQGRSRSQTSASTAVGRRLWRARCDKPFRLYV